MKKLLSVEQIRQWDAATIENEPIASVDLMERAAKACTSWLFRHGLAHRRFTVVCGVGNNGGDGLAIARLLLNAGCCVDAIVVLGQPERATRDFQINLERLHVLGAKPSWFDGTGELAPCDVCIDALFGTGLDRPIDGAAFKVIAHLNAQACTILSIDVPSGLPGNPDAFSVHHMVDADHVLTFQQYKEALLHPKPDAQLKRRGEVHVLDIGLSDGFFAAAETTRFTFDRRDAALRIIDRQRFSHKGSYGAAYIAAGSASMPGAALLAVKAALRSGCGLVFAQVPAKAQAILQIGAPEAMASADEHSTVLTRPSIPEKATAIACGPGMGTGQEQYAFLTALLNDSRPIVLDADALNTVAHHPSLKKQIAEHGKCILTPLPAEFDRLFGVHTSLGQRLATALVAAAELNAVIHLKGAYSTTVFPDGRAVFHLCGSPALAVGGSGDVLTGLVVGLLAAGYDRENAMLLGAALHGTAGECYEEEFGRMGLTAGALVDRIPQAWKALRSLV